ncbi:PIN domain-containing protein [Pontixanthobacter luteolus]|uniref:PIN domain-containing protein n=1 Tax=Pontixanthobacter luteolus TaxID=295089 RepID=UPI0023043434|nr:PIN domain-containing protein [Pontixanthobacter luteolus]
MPYDAITIDTNVAVHSGLDLESGMMAQLFQFKEAPIDFVIADVVVWEMRRHLLNATRKARDTAISAIKKAITTKLVEGAAVGPLSEAAENLVDPGEAVKARLTNFLMSTGASFASSEDVAAAKVMKLYFNAKPPFDEAGAKKAEFPDAVALLALEAWAKSNGKKILAVSADKGWQTFAENSDCIDVESDLGNALATLQTHTENASQTVTSFIHALENATCPNLTQELEEELSASVANLGVIAEGESYLSFEMDGYEVTLLDFAPVGELGENGSKIVRLGNDEIVAQVRLTLSLQVEAVFTLSVKDGIDKDYISMGSAANEVEVDIEADALITLSGALDGPLKDLTVLKAELVEKTIAVDFGSIDIDYGDEEEYESWLEEQEQEVLEAEALAAEEANHGDG